MSRREHSRGIKLNCSLSVPTSSDSSLHTPNTPEILNTIVNITESLGHNTVGHSLPLHPLQIKNALLSDNAIIPAPCPAPIVSSSSSTLYNPPSLISPGSPATPSEFLATTPSSPPTPALPTSEYPSPSSPDHFSVKEELKLKLSKNLRRVSEESMVYPGCSSIKKERDDLTADDTEKRRRRRERNKVAAEKCRNKRKKAIEKLYSESESVSVQNAKFKEDIQRLEAEHRHLMMVLEQHKPVCRRNNSGDSSDGGILNAANDVVKKEVEDSSDMFRDRVDTFSSVYKYSGDVYDSSSNYNFGFSGGYYDTACFAV